MIKPIDGPSSTNRGGTDSGSVGVSRGAPQGPGVKPNQANLKGTGGPQASSGSNASGKKHCRNARPSDKLTFDELYSHQDFVKFYTIKSTSDSNLTKLNMFKVDKAIRNLIGTCEKITEDFRNKSWTVQVRTSDQGAKLQEMTKLIEEPVIVIPHEQYNQSQGVITCSLLKGYSDEDIAEGLSEHGVIACRRIIRKPKSPEPEPTTTLILTFKSATPPDKITIRTGLVERVRLYVPLPRRCFNCQNYGHSGARCRRQFAVCIRCGDDSTEGHTAASCQSPVNCYHCKEPHEVNSKTCPRYLLEKEILSVKTKEHLSFSEARSKVILTLPAGGRSFAATAKLNEPRTNRTQDMNNNSQRTPLNATNSSKKRPLQRTESISPEKSQPKEKKRIYDQYPTNPTTPLDPTPTQNRYEFMETTIPPDYASTSKRNSAPDIIAQSQIEQELLNTMRKTSKDKNKKKEKEAPAHRTQSQGLSK